MFFCSARKAAAETARVVNAMPKPVKMIVLLKEDGGSDAARLSKALPEGVLSSPVKAFAPIADAEGAGAAAEDAQAAAGAAEEAAGGAAEAGAAEEGVGAAAGRGDATCCCPDNHATNRSEY